MLSNNIFDANHSRNINIDPQKTMSQILPTKTNSHNLVIDNDKDKYQRPNIPLLIVDLLLLPIHIFRMVLIYFFGSKYNLKGFTFLDVIMHADKPYFNQEDCRLINTIGDDYRVVIRDDSRIFPMDLNNYFKSSNLQSSNAQLVQVSNSNNNTNVIVGDVSDGSNQNSGIWDISTEVFEDDKKTKKINDNDENEDCEDREDDDSSESDTESDSDDDKKIKGVNYFEANDEPVTMLAAKRKNDILDSIRDELNSAFEN